MIKDLYNISSIIAPLFYKLLYLSITATFVGVSLLVIRKVADKKISPKWKYTMWLVFVLALILPIRPNFMLSINGPMQTEQLQNISYRDSYDNANIVEPTFDNNIKISQIENSNSTKPLILKSLIFDIVIPISWLIGVIVFGMFLIIGTVRLKINISKSNDEEFLRIGRILKDSKEKMKIKNNISIVLQDYVKTPAIFGMVSPKILLPKYIEEMTDENIEYIVLHELSHYRRGDSFVNNILILLQIIYWFNPLTWIFFKFIRQDMELATDEYVLNIIGYEKHKNYSLSFVEVLKKYSSLPLVPKLLCMADDSSNVEHRIKMIKLNEFFRKKKIIISIVSILIICILSLIFLTTGSNSHYLNTNRIRQTKLTEKEIQTTGIFAANPYCAYEYSVSKEYKSLVLTIDRCENGKFTSPSKYIVQTIPSKGKITVDYKLQDSQINFTLINIYKGVGTFSDSINMDVPWKTLGYSSILTTDKEATIKDSNEFNVMDVILTKDGSIRAFHPTTNDELKTFDCIYMVKGMFSTKSAEELKTELSTKSNALDLYILKNKDVTGNDDVYFTMLPHTTINKLENNIFDISKAVKSVDEVNKLLENYPEVTDLQIYQINSTDVSDEEMISIGEKVKLVNSNGVKHMNLSLDTLLISSYDIDKIEKYKTSYVGDNSKDSALVSLLPLPSTDFVQRFISIQSQNEPFGLTAYYESKEGEKKFNLSETSKTVLEANALVMFCMIDNMGEITFKYRSTPSSNELEEDKYDTEYSFKRKDFESKYGDLKKLSENPQLLKGEIEKIIRSK